MKKRSQKRLTKLLDFQCSAIVRSLGYCQRCWAPASKVQLQAAHIVGRGNFATRWDLDNILCLCASCHFWAHENPMLFTKFVENEFGVGCEDLNRRASLIHQWTIEEKEELLMTLKEINPNGR